MQREIGRGGSTEGSPDGIRFTTLAEHPDELGLYRADQEAFADHFGFSPESFEVWRQRRFDADADDRSRWLLALEGDQIVAFLRQVTGGEVAQVAALGRGSRGAAAGSDLPFCVEPSPRWRMPGIAR